MTPARGGTADLPVAAFIGPRNAEAVTGQPWRWCRDHARRWGVPILRADAKPLIRADEFFRALEHHASVERIPDNPTNPTELEAATELEAMRKRVRMAATRGAP